MAISIIRHYLIEGLKDQYLTMENPLNLWTALQRRYDHQKTVLLPKARYEWKNLRFMDYKSMDEYNSANNELLMKNSEMRPPGSAPLPEAHKAEHEKKDPKESNHIYNERRTHGRGRGGYKGRGGRDNYSYGRGYGNHNNCGRGSSYGRGRANFGRGRGGISKPSYSTKSVCHRCGMSNHWAKNCRTPKHLCELYQESLKNKNPEAHMVHDNGYDSDDDFDHETDDLMDH
ncbi:uncharacterized protein LOC106383254 [Brassica napus]|uniref:uncharacterized protein LOC106383254 n=1 Tax=Brassica napus TaxID=3708 RepID=UPI0006AB32D6|nr:uncharacterized protein LOC106383254 [Brassica napus]